MQKLLGKVLMTVCGLLMAATAMAKLAAPSEEAKAKGAEAAAKNAWAGKVGAYQLCKSQDRTAAFFFKTAKARGQETRPAAPTPACADPGAFSYTPAGPTAALAPGAPELAKKS